MNEDKGVTNFPRLINERDYFKAENARLLARVARLEEIIQTIDLLDAATPAEKRWLSPRMRLEIHAALAEKE